MASVDSGLGERSLVVLARVEIPERSQVRIRRHLLRCHPAGLHGIVSAGGAWSRTLSAVREEIEVVNERDKDYAAQRAAARPAEEVVERLLRRHPAP